MSEIGKIYQTSNFSIFKTLYANREVLEPRKKILKKSIKENGYICNPIIVNEKMEVIDGQGRLEACKELDVPICYIIIKGLTIDDCMILNSNMKQWSMKDFIESYAQQGNKNYVRLLDLADMGFRLTTYFFANALMGGSGKVKGIVEEGRAICTEEGYIQAKKALKYLKQLKPYIDKVEARKASIECAIVFAYFDKNVDNERLISATKKYYNLLEGTYNFDTAFDKLGYMYNRYLKNKADKIYLREDYHRYIDSKCGYDFE